MRAESMTSHYLDIHLRPDPDLAPSHLMGSLFGRLHRALVQLGQQAIGVSFPEHDERKPSLGTHLRLHGPEPTLFNLVESAWLHGLHDHVRIDTITPNPVDSRHRVVSRVQVQSNVDRLRRRAMNRHGLSQEQASNRIPASAEDRLRLPFATLGSRSTGQPSFPLFIRHGPLLDNAAEGSFNTYGLSHQATVPWF